MSIDRIPLPRTAGAMWVCGRHDVGPDVEAALKWADDASTVVCLLPVDEIEARYPDYVAWLQANRAGRAIWFPIPNFSAPSARAVVPVVRMIVDRLESGEGVLVHCALGQGRAGTITACVLIALGQSADDAVRTVAANRVFGGPANAAQWALVDAVAELLSAANRSSEH